VPSFSSSVLDENSSAEATNDPSAFEGADKDLILAANDPFEHLADVMEIIKASGGSVEFSYEMGFVEHYIKNIGNYDVPVTITDVNSQSDMLHVLRVVSASRETRGDEHKKHRMVRYSGKYTVG